VEKNYNFSDGVRGKFYIGDAETFLPVYLEPETRTFIENIAKKNNKDVSTVVNDLLKTEIELVKYSS